MITYKRFYDKKRWYVQEHVSDKREYEGKKIII